MRLTANRFPSPYSGLLIIGAGHGNFARLEIVFVLLMTTGLLNQVVTILQEPASNPPQFW